MSRDFGNVRFFSGKMPISIFFYGCEGCFIQVKDA